MPRRNLFTILGVVMLSLVSWRIAPGAGADEDKYEFYRQLIDALDHIEKSYVTEVERERLLKSALDGMLNSLDPHSAYISPDEFEQFEKNTRGEFGGIGISISQRNGQLMVVSPLVGSPAYRAGVLAGDRIVEIEGEPTQDLTIDEAVKKLTGSPGTEVRLAVVHEGKSDKEEILLKREIIKLESVLGYSRKDDDSWDWIPDDETGIAYIQIKSFINTTAGDLRAAVEAAKSEGMKALILDLRNNPGGLLTSAVDVSNMFLKEGDEIVSVQGRNTRARTSYANGDGPFGNFPMAILVNGGSASASEIVSAALKDHDRAVVVGERTFGKGSVQNVIELEGGRSALKLTTAEYHRPNGQNIHRRPGAKESDQWGVQPNDGFEVKFSPQQLMQLWLKQRDRETLGTGEEELEFEDRQLEKAQEYLLEKLKPAEVTKN